MKNENSPENIKAFIEKETRALAGEYLDEVWDEIEEAKLDIDIVAEVFISRVLAKVAASKGEKYASRIVEHFARQDEMGTLSGSRTLQ